jgi:hypothetical protein
VSVFFVFSLSFWYASIVALFTNNGERSMKRKKNKNISFVENKSFRLKICGRSSFHFHNKYLLKRKPQLLGKNDRVIKKILVSFSIYIDPFYLLAMTL